MVSCFFGESTGGGAINGDGPRRALEGEAGTDNFGEGLGGANVEVIVVLPLNTRFDGGGGSSDGAIAKAKSSVDAVGDGSLVGLLGFFAEELSCLMSSSLCLSNLEDSSVGSSSRSIISVVSSEQQMLVDVPLPMVQSVFQKKK